MKTVYGWVVNWGEVSGVQSTLKDPNITIDLFFSSEEEFEKLYGCSDLKEQILIPVKVPDDFNHLDFIPDNY